ncbi:MAG: hypothetical protein F6K58_12145, partial [Symploca sp. SIO2E9]|nr:hypothetical protein [Symploca sp. SIO2E9]
ERGRGGEGEKGRGGEGERGRRGEGERGRILYTNIPPHLPHFPILLHPD